MFRVLPELDAAGPAVDVLHVSSVELFDALPREERDRILAPGTSDRAMAITDFTLPTLYRFVTSPEGREASLHPFRRGGYPGSGKAERVLEQAGLDARSQLDAIRRFAARVAG